jgi:translin
MPLSKIMKQMTRELDRKDAAREQIISGSRQIIRLTRQSVALIHHGEARKAKLVIQDALKELRELSKASKEYPELYYGGILTPAQQEIAEAAILEGLTEGQDFPQFEENLISPPAYLLGMADAVGEFRRVCLDSLRGLKLERAKESFSRMEEIYQALVELDYPSGLTPGLCYPIRGRLLSALCRLRAAVPAPVPPIHAARHRACSPPVRTYEGNPMTAL